MLFVFHYVDKPNRAELRAANRAAHLEYADKFAERIVIGGPTLSEDGTAMTGSVIIMEFENRAAAEAFAADDPYVKAGLFESTVIRPFKKVRPVG